MIWAQTAHIILNKHRIINIMTEFLGFKQVTKKYYDKTANNEKVGYLWLVRDGEYAEDGETLKEAKSSDIYFGTRHYGHVGPEVENIQDLLITIQNNIKNLEDRQDEDDDIHLITGDDLE